MTAPGPAAGDPVAAGREWLSRLPRPATAHRDRGPDPLQTVRHLLSAIGDPHLRLRVVHIAGSKGKGSTALFAEGLLGRLGQRTFTYTSPHLERWTERFRIDAREADPASALAALEAVRAAAERLGVVPGFFEALTVAAFELAVREGAEWAVIEAGVGGRADATNVVEPAVTVLTGIEREHADRLGETLQEIAAEKAGIIKQGAPLIVPRLPPGLAGVVRAAAQRQGSEQIELRPSLRPPRSPGTERRVLWHYAGPWITAAGPGWAVRARLATPGTAMARNAVLALAAVARLGIASAEELQDAGRALGGIVLPGRMETVSTLPWVIIDGAHTPASARSLADAVADLGPARLHLLLSLSAGKEAAAVLEPLLVRADAVTVTRADADYSLPAAGLAAAVQRQRPDLPVEALDDPDEALAAAGGDAPGETLVLATGSVYLAGRVRGAFRA